MMGHRAHLRRECHGCVGTQVAVGVNEGAPLMFHLTLRVDENDGDLGNPMAQVG